MQFFTISSSGELEIIPSESSSKNDFNFLLGQHNVHHKKLKTRLDNCTEWIEFDGDHTMQPLLNGLGNLEQHFMPSTGGDPIEGIALRLFNPVTKLWSIFWSDSNTGILDNPVVGSFEKNIGHFLAKDIFNGKPILLQFKWDATNAENLEWSQAFSDDNGKTWEWNWYMYFTKYIIEGNTSREIERQTPALESENIGVLELRNYVIKAGYRDRFIDYFEEHFIISQIELKGYALGQYRVKGQENNFCWFRGFKNMESRGKFLPSFYYGPVWKQHRNTANGMLANNDNVHLLRPLTLENDSLIPAETINSARLVPQKGVVVVDFYTANNKLDQLLKFFAKEYIPLIAQFGVSEYSLWISELSNNDFPALPVFQDMNLLVAITFYNDELEYVEKLKMIQSRLDETIKTAMQDIITFKNTLVLYPTFKTTSY